MSIIDKARWEKLEMYDMPKKAWIGSGLRIAMDPRCVVYRARVYPTANDLFLVQVWDFKSRDWLDTGEADSKAHAYKLARTMAKMYDKPGEET